jgi:site-specific DNA-methyltransferase (adenine-specific)
MPDWDVIEGDCIDAMAGMPEASVDAIVCDPPYGLGFMGRAWDDLPPGLLWAEACLRVLKPGGHLLAFGGTRTSHRLVCAIEDAGFEIRDTICWLYGSGFPKSLDVGKAIDKAAGVEREVVGQRPTYPDGTRGGIEKPQHERVATGLGGSFVNPGGLTDVTAPASPEAERWEGWGTALKPAHEPVVVARKPLVGTVSANVLVHGTGGLNVDGCRIDLVGNLPDTVGRWPANVVLDEEAARLLDEQTGTLTSGIAVQRNRNDAANRAVYGKYANPACEDVGYSDSGGASRFFYCAKASARERSEGLDGERNAHPTVKPLAFMRWLVRLVTPPGGLVLDPFAGSGTTGVAALSEGMRFVGVEREAEYVQIARARIGAWRAEAQGSLFAV